ncbi:hypothetical protein SY91_06543 [Burkholderia cenocepacia]|nr:hypothetical protein P355_1142 [Burkholderia cenocepacia KC-01]QND99075.1 hypothetical protein SY91_06543 [Burkholderia cenocepacia]
MCRAAVDAFLEAAASAPAGNAPAVQPQLSSDYSRNENDPFSAAGILSQPSSFYTCRKR